MHYVKRQPFPRPEYPRSEWLNSVVDGALAPLRPPEDQLLGSFRSREGKKLDVRSIDQPDFLWVFSVVDGEIAKAVPPLYEPSYRVAERPKLDVRRIAQPNIDWLSAVLGAPAFDTALWPAIEQSLRSYRASDRRRLDPRAVDEPAFSWVGIPVERILAQQIPPLYEETSSFRTYPKRAVDVRNVPQPSDGWLGILHFVAFNPVNLPAVFSLLHSFRARSGRAVDVRNIPQPGFGWITPVLPPIVIPPAVELWTVSGKTPAAWVNTFLHDVTVPGGPYVTAAGLGPFGETVWTKSEGNARVWEETD